MAPSNKTKRNKPQVVTTLDPRIIVMMDKLCELRVCANKSELVALLVREEHEKIFGKGGNGAPGRTVGGEYPAPASNPATLNEPRQICPAKK